MDWRSFFFSFRGRINQAKYWLALLIFTIVGMVQGLVGFALGNAVLFQIFNFLIDLAVLVASIAVGIKRLHDRDRSAWWLLLFYLGPVVFAGAGGGDHVGWRELCRNDRGLVAISAALPARWFCALGIWGLVEIGFLRGSAGYNRFGPNPLGKHQSRA
jgi:uncharacterized membrane protein YhaH (DUF805 family)